MRKFMYLLLFLLSVGGLDAYAQKQLVVEPKGGSTDSYVLSDSGDFFKNATDQVLTLGYRIF